MFIGVDNTVNIEHYWSFTQRLAGKIFSYNCSYQVTINLNKCDWAGGGESLIRHGGVFVYCARSHNLSTLQLSYKSHDGLTEFTVSVEQHWRIDKPDKETYDAGQHKNGEHGPVGKEVTKREHW